MIAQGAVMTRDVIFTPEIIRVAAEMQRQKAFPAVIVAAKWAVPSGFNRPVYGKNNYFDLTVEQAPEAGREVCTYEDMLTQTQLDKFNQTERMRIAIKEEDPSNGAWVKVTMTRQFPSFLTLEDSAKAFVRLFYTREPYRTLFRRHLENGLTLQGMASALTRHRDFAMMLSGVNRFADLSRIMGEDIHFMDGHFMSLLESPMLLQSLRQEKLHQEGL